MLTIITFILVLSLLIFVHELGHFLTAKKAGITVEEFGIGFPPRALKVWQDEGEISLDGHEYLIGRRIDLPRRLEVGSTVTMETKTRADGRVEVTRLELVSKEEDGAPTATGGQNTARVTALEKPTEYSLNWIPFGGYVKMLGEEDPTAPGSFASKGKLARFTVLVAGAAMNLVTAFIVFSIMYMTGIPESFGKAYIEQVAPNSPAEEAGLQPGDIITQLDDQPIDNHRALVSYIRQHTGEPIEFYVERSDETLNFELVPRVNPPPGEGAVGIVIGTQVTEQRITQQPVGPAILQGGLTTVGLVIRTFTFPIDLIRNLIPAEQARPVGPVGIYQWTDSAVQASAETGVIFPILLLTGLLSVALAVTNLLPLPALDGGRILFVIIEAIRGKRVSPEKEGAIHFVGLAFLLTLMLVISYNDVVNPIEVPDWMGIFR